MSSDPRHLHCDDAPLLADQPCTALAELLGGPARLPKRWGRMNRLSRRLIVATARLLISQGFAPGERLEERGLRIGLIGATRYGSLATDREFLATMEQGPGLASPALFGYTLANIPLAEAAVTFGLTGPVYALHEVEKDSLLDVAAEECRLHLAFSPHPDALIACAFDQGDCGDADSDCTELLYLT